VASRQHSRRQVPVTREADGRANIARTRGAYYHGRPVRDRHIVGRTFGGVSLVLRAEDRAVNFLSQQADIADVTRRMTQDRWRASHLFLLTQESDRQGLIPAEARQ
jgi:nicotinate-nucleotide pyrophosphorylase